MDKGTTAAALGGVAAGSLIALALGSAQRARAAPAPEGIDPSVWEMLVSLLEANAVQAQQVEQLTTNITNLTVTLGGGPIIGEDPFENKDKFTTGQVITTVAGRGFQLPPIPVPKFKQVAVKALPGNVGWMFVGVSASQAQNASVAWPLVPNEGVRIFVNNMERIWVVSQIVNDGVAFIVEQN